MAERRMFAKTIIDSDAFIDMPVSARLLYYDLSMRADDEGFVNSPKKIMRMTGTSEDDLRILITKKFIIPFENGIVVIKHWYIHNYIRKDTSKETTYVQEKECLELDENKAYRVKNDDRRRSVDEPSTQVSIGKVSIGKDSINNTYVQSNSQNHSAQDLANEETPIITLILNDKSEYAVVENQVIKWQELYPAVDVMQELRKMKGWLDANQSRRKTRRGIQRFINGWLSKAQDNPKNISNVQMKEVLPF